MDTHGHELASRSLLFGRPGARHHVPPTVAQADVPLAHEGRFLPRYAGSAFMAPKPQPEKKNDRNLVARRAAALRRGVRCSGRQAGTCRRPRRALGAIDEAELTDCRRFTRL